MNLDVLNQDFVRIAVIDVGEALIWTDRYATAGDFELTLSANNSQIEHLVVNNYLMFNGSERTMIIESIQTTKDTEEGNKFIVGGRSLESILDRRVVWDITTVTGSLQTAVELILNENVIAPSDDDRRIPDVVFMTSTDVAIIELTCDEQYNGQYIYDVIVSLCAANSIGFKIVLNDDNEFEFSLFAGVDRSYDQTANPYVIFSPEFDNIINSNFYTSNQLEKTASLLLVTDVSDVYERLEVDLSLGASIHLDRREITTDARDLSRDPGGENPLLTDTEFLTLLTDRGAQDILANQAVSFFDGQMSVSKTFTYGVDFSMGDIVQITNDYGQSARSRITEIVYSEYQGGIEFFPSFTTLT